MRASRSPMAIEQEDPPGSAASAADGAATAASSSGGGAECIGGQAPPDDRPSEPVGPVDPSAKRDMMESTRRGPAPLALSDESRSSRGIKVPDGPTASEKEAHYLTHIPFRS